jgi:RNA-binding protein YhbY
VPEIRLVEIGSVGITFTTIYSSHYILVGHALIRWKMFETYLEDVDEAVEQIRNNRYSSVIEHMGGNMYLTVDNNDKMDCCYTISII